MNTGIRDRFESDCETWSNIAETQANSGDHFVQGF